MTQLSYSSLTTFEACNRKYWHYKINKTDKDIDADDDTIAFRYGKAFHQVLEDTQHDLSFPGMNKIIDKALKDHNVEKFAHQVFACLESYFTLHKKTKLKAVFCEFKLSTPTLSGYIDVILVDRNGFWWICDLKTSGMLKIHQLAARLHEDLQLNIYASFAKDVGESLELDPDKYLGCRYRVVEKPRIKVKEGETLRAYSNRVKVNCFDIEIPKNTMNIEAAIKLHATTQAFIKYNDKKSSYPMNRQSCLDYFKPCEYWSQCYGANFSECGDKNVVVMNQKTAQDVTRYDKGVSALDLI